jgi:hypothetical protein
LPIPYIAFDNIKVGDLSLIHGKESSWKLPGPM